MIHRLALAALSAAALAAGAAQRPEETRDELEVVGDVHDAVGRNDCRRAVSRLNDGLADRQPGTLLLAGAMYETGVCVKASWERAAHMYQRAYEVGHHGGLLRLVAGHAHGRRDMAAALWWAHQGEGVPAPAACTIAEADRADPERFVAALKRWPLGLLEACVYTLGVVAGVAAEVEYPAKAVRMGIAGELTMSFTPAAGEITWSTAAVEKVDLIGRGTGGPLAGNASRRASGVFETYLREIGERTLARHARPEGVPADWAVRMKFTFNMAQR